MNSTLPTFSYRFLSLQMKELFLDWFIPITGPILASSIDLTIQKSFSNECKKGLIHKIIVK